MLREPRYYDDVDPNHGANMEALELATPPTLSRMNGECAAELARLQWERDMGHEAIRRICEALVNHDSDLHADCHECRDEIVEMFCEISRELGFGVRIVMPPQRPRLVETFDLPEDDNQ